MTRVQQRLNSNHGRLMLAARAVPERIRDVRMPGQEATPREVLAHVLAWQEEAVMHLLVPDAPWPVRHQPAAAHRHLGWDAVLERLEANHELLRDLLIEEPPRWFGQCTYGHYGDHTRGLLAFLRSFAQSPTTTVAPMAAQS